MAEGLRPELQQYTLIQKPSQNFKFRCRLSRPYINNIDLFNLRDSTELKDSASIAPRSNSTTHEQSIHFDSRTADLIFAELVSAHIGREGIGHGEET